LKIKSDHCLRLKNNKKADSNLELAQAQDKALKSDGFERWKRNALLAINSVKGWYDFIYTITTSREDISK
jgi:hypothetical protein